MSLYTDRGSHYFRTTKAGEIDRGCPAQAGKALAQLCVEHRRFLAAGTRPLGAGVPDASGSAPIERFSMFSSCACAISPVGKKPSPSFGVAKPRSAFGRSLQKFV
jgi:hypothetical protein